MTSTTWVKRLYRWIRRTLGGSELGRELLGWTDPLHISRSLLRTAVQERAQLATGALLDIGAGNQPYRDLFPHTKAYVAMDLPPSENVAVYGDALALPFKDGIFDSVLCNEVLEHVPEPGTLLMEVARVLRPGGVLLLSTPQTWGLHHEPYDFYRYTKYGLAYLTRKAGLEVSEIVATSGLWGTFAQRVADTVVYTYAARSSSWVRELLGISLAPVLLAGKTMDKVAGRRGDTLDNILVARKPDVGAGA